MPPLARTVLSASPSTTVTRHGDDIVRPASRGYADAADVASSLRPEEPVFCFSPAVLEARIHAFLDGFPGEVSYAVKANPGEHVLLTACAAGLAVFDVASVEEMALVRSIAPRARLHYHNPVKSRAEIARALAVFGCRRFAVDDHQEIAKIAALAEGAEDIELAVRFRMAPAGLAAHDFSTKFGVAADEAVSLLEDVVARGFRPVLTFHPGSQCTWPDAYARHIATAASIARKAGVRLAALNVGGGFPAAYAGSAGPALSDYFSAIAAAVTRCFPADHHPRLECEPGRGLVASCTSLLARVKLVRAHRREVFLNDGIYGALMEASQSSALLPRHRVIRDGHILPAGSGAWTVYGPTCDPLDVLPGALALADDIAEGDHVEFGPLGAYAAATATRFNGYDVSETVTVGKVLGDDEARP